MSDTPRTDAAQTGVHDYTDLAVLCRQMERELQQARARIGEVRAVIESMPCCCEGDPADGPPLPDRICDRCRALAAAGETPHD